jgi:hypothetical protein
MDSQTVRRVFVKTAEVSLSDYAELRLAIFRKTREKALASTLAEQFARSLSLEWESFLDNLIVTYVLEQSTHYMKQLKFKIEQSLKDRYGSGAQRRTTFDSRRPTSKHEVSSLVDPKNFNVTAKTSTELATRANEFLAARLARNFALERSDAEFFDFAVSMRNFVSHRSRGSLSLLKDNLDALSEMENDVFKASTTSKFSLHGYLKEIVCGDFDRVELLGFRYIEIAEKL